MRSWIAGQLSSRVGDGRVEGRKGVTCTSISTTMRRDMRRTTRAGAASPFRRFDRQFPEAIVDTKLGQQSHQPYDRQAHDREIVAFNPLDDRGAKALNPVSAGFIHRLAGRDVRVDLVIGQLPELDVYFLDA